MEKLVEVASELYNLQMLITAYKEKADKFKGSLVKLSDGQTKEYGDFKFLRIISAGSVDYSKIEFLKTIDLDKYRRPSRESWKLVSLHEKNKFMRKVENDKKM